ncbi:hypothetical protein HA402_009683 [Bradysia odoriphaga]|nr:hypothetical protein HA402_009683 [Bradysia odoriphaga]
MIVFSDLCPHFQRVAVIFIFACVVVNAGVIDNRVDKYVDVHGNCAVPPKLLDEIQSYQPIVNRIAKEILNGTFTGDTWNSLSEFIDEFGPRFSGSKSLERSIDYMVNKLKEVGLENVHTENAIIPRWQRGYESAHLVEPHEQNLPILGFGFSVGTPRGGIIGDVVVVESFDELDSLSDDVVHGKIVVFVPEWVSYGVTVQYRSKGASKAAKKGAVAALVRSITPFSIGSPHTGMQTYEKGVAQIPVAAITVEDSKMLLRLYRRGKRITIRLEMEDRNLDPYDSRNTISELHGCTQPIDKKVVVVSGHLDSWDVGVGAMDDGGGAFISWKAIEFLKKMNLRPARTIRSILWTGEEVGIVGAEDYQRAHAANEQEEFNFFIESDIGTFEPTGLDFSGNADAECIFQEILKLMAPLNATEFSKPTDGGPDIERWTNRGFPGASLLNRNENYFWYHHSAGDSMLLEQPQNLDKATALFAACAYVVADLSIDMPRDIQ